ncbi:SDR family oxidoreductase [Gordonia sp. zg691]|uniref:SDR family NAD(P)-dependent oxidoreductase n=1 Tax=Gordonia jinghuaiqii TaxID=2758710 RepID=UPI001662435E|nr:SDR family NAD(P)-dependent oxidoreductase [Gordonia jinghuaiqii]MBD0860489.1 SDR family oxidoreductase [Gordonia jinghuaiqii]
MYPDNRPLTGRTALVTGSGRGLGRAIADSLADAGAHVWVVARTEDELSVVLDGIRDRGGTGDIATVDLRSPAELADLTRRVMSATPVVDILVNNAGINRKKPVLPLDTNTAQQPGARPHHDAMTDDDWTAILDTHVTASLSLIRSFVPAMLAQQHGRIINIGSSSTVRSPDYCVPYQVGKGALDHLTRGLAKEWAPFNITVNSIAPGHFRTSMTQALHDSEEGQQWLRERIPMRRTGNPQELGALAVHLASDHASFITGQTIYVDGGETL